MGIRFYRPLPADLRDNVPLGPVLALIIVYPSIYTVSIYTHIPICVYMCIYDLFPQINGTTPRWAQYWRS